MLGPEHIGRRVAVRIRLANPEPGRRFTDVTGEPFWTIVAEATVPQIDDFFTVEERLTANETLREAMADYHDLVESGRREIYRVES